MGRCPILLLLTVAIEFIRGAELIPSPDPAGCLRGLTGKRSMEAEMADGEYTVTLDTENNIVHVVVQGVLTKELGEEIITNARAAAAEHKYRILCDVRGVDVKVPLADWFFLPRTLPIFKDAKIRTIRSAVLVSPGTHKRVYDFYETVTHNLGMSVRVFLDEDKAVDWLKASREAAPTV
jgi:hypothetical protein